MHPTEIVLVPCEQQSRSVSGQGCDQRDRSVTHCNGENAVLSQLTHSRINMLTHSMISMLTHPMMSMPTPSMISMFYLLPPLLSMLHLLHSLISMLYLLHSIISMLYFAAGAGQGLPGSRWA